MSTREEKVAEYNAAREEAFQKLQNIFTEAGLSFSVHQSSWFNRVSLNTSLDSSKVATTASIEICGTKASFGYSISSCQILPLKFKVECDNWGLRKDFRARTFNSMEKAIDYAKQIQQHVEEGVEAEIKKAQRNEDMAIRLQPVIEALNLLNVNGNWKAEYEKDRNGNGFIKFGPYYSSGLSIYLGQNGWDANSGVEVSGYLKVEELMRGLSALNEVMSTLRP